MSLEVGKFFVRALSDNSTLYSMVSGRIFPVSRTMEDDIADRVPYIVMQPEGLTNEAQNKDDVEGPADRCTIGLLVCAETYDALVTLTQMIRSTIRQAANDGLQDSEWSFALDGYDFSADAVNYDPSKPCFYQTLRYVTYTTNYD